MQNPVTSVCKADLGWVWGEVRILLSVDEKQCLQIDLGRWCLLGLPAHLDGYPKVTCGYRSKTPPEMKDLSDRQEGPTGLTLKIWRILSKSRPQATIKS